VRTTPAYPGFPVDSFALGTPRQEGFIMDDLKFTVCAIILLIIGIFATITIMATLMN